MKKGKYHLRRKVVNIYTELLKFKLSTVFNFIHTLTHETYIPCQETVGS